MHDKGKDPFLLPLQEIMDKTPAGLYQTCLF